MGGGAVRPVCVGTGGQSRVPLAYVNMPSGGPTGHGTPDTNNASRGQPSTYACQAWITCWWILNVTSKDQDVTTLTGTAVRRVDIGRHAAQVF